MNDQIQNTEVSTEKAAPKEIIRGRMPVAVVHLVRFGSQKDGATKAVADAFGTTVGKVDDIKKNRNFSYVTEDFRPTEQQKADAIAWLQRHPGGAPQDLIDELNSIETANADQAAAFEAARVAARGQNVKTKEGDDADAGGGNRRSKRGKKADAEASPEDAAATGDSLLS